jgi:hypothetical protein
MFRTRHRCAWQQSAHQSHDRLSAAHRLSNFAAWPMDRREQLGPARFLPSAP